MNGFHLRPPSLLTYVPGDLQTILARSFDNIRRESRQLLNALCFTGGLVFLFFGFFLHRSR